MTVDLSLLRLQLFERFDALLAAVDEFCTVVRHDAALPLWVARTETERGAALDMRIKALRLYRALWYEEGQDGRETVTCPGLLGASPATLTSAQACNDAKDAFKAAVLALKTLSKLQSNALLDELRQRDPTVASAMKRLGAARLNLKQAYRHIPMLDVKPLKVGFTWSKQGRAIQRTSVAEARRLLERKRESPQALLESRRLADIPETEVLARIRTIVPHLRANIVFAKETYAVERRLMQTPLPLLVPLKPGEPLPDYVPIPAEPTGAVRLRRSDVRIEEEVFLPSIRVHRYRAPYR